MQHPHTTLSFVILIITQESMNCLETKRITLCLLWKLAPAKRTSAGTDWNSSSYHITVMCIKAIKQKYRKVQPCDKPTLPFTDTAVFTQALRQTQSCFAYICSKRKSFSSSWGGAVITVNCWQSEGIHFNESWLKSSPLLSRQQDSH